MSVPKSKRTSDPELDLITKSREMASHTIRICSNEKNFPKRYRWCLTNKIVDDAIDINRYINAANSINCDRNPEDYDIRREYQVNGLAKTYSLLSTMDIAYNTFHIDGNKIEYWTGLVLDVQNKLRGWKTSDEKRFSNK